MSAEPVILGTPRGVNEAGAAMPADDLIKETTTQAFRADVIDASQTVPVLVDFWAPWCPPCRMVAPHLEELGRRHAGRLIVAKVDTDRHSRTASSLRVRSIPTLAIWKGGKLVKAQAGALVGPQLESYVAPVL
jgi:putative thioredoxin